MIARKRGGERQLRREVLAETVRAQVTPRTCRLGRDHVQELSPEVTQSAYLGRTERAWLGYIILTLETAQPSPNVPTFAFQLFSDSSTSRHASRIRIRGLRHEYLPTRCRRQRLHPPCRPWPVSLHLPSSLCLAPRLLTVLIYRIGNLHTAALVCS